MRVKNNKKSSKDPTCWTFVDSRHKLLQRTDEGTIVIEGEAGFGKSILLTQYAYDWYSSTADSPLKKDTIFILLRLREFKKSGSIFETIKLLLLNDLSLSCNEIEDIITSQSWKVVFAFDGYDEFKYRDSTHVDVLKIIHGRMLTSSLVIVSTRPECWTKLQNSAEIRCRLTGFDRSIQNMYIEKVIIPNTEKRDIKTLISQTLQANGFLSDICQVPLFFVIFAHMKYTNHDELNITTVTGYFKYMLSCSLIHSKSKETDETKSRFTRQEENYYQASMAKFAFDGLFSQNFVWEKTEMMRLVDLSCYTYYIKAGIILEEHNSRYKVHPGCHMDDESVDEINVRFFHKTFQEYYAAIHFVYLVSKERSMDVSAILSKFYENELQYFFQFACGLKPTSAKVVQDYLGSLRGGQILSILCSVEQETQDTGKIVESFSRRTTIDWLDSRIHVSAMIQILQIASHQRVGLPRSVY
ncbi:NLR family CARD domain-containing protein 4 [Holothuria leucospilota]|uniref:NLR family CARD domain-containing protein 4 n=1 Tax=Holothuria leucospilota TaxID=206669 RepID=A0A9Q1HLH5_HOLLE|nr:NLR family CARD domain-containing protein 4 [Holothuria leucospilota]